MLFRSVVVVNEETMTGAAKNHLRSKSFDLRCYVMTDPQRRIPLSHVEFLEHSNSTQT